MIVSRAGDRLGADLADGGFGEHAAKSTGRVDVNFRCVDRLRRQRGRPKSTDRLSHYIGPDIRYDQPRTGRVEPTTIRG